MKLINRIGFMLLRPDGIEGQPPQQIPVPPQPQPMQLVPVQGQQMVQAPQAAPVAQKMPEAAESGPWLGRGISFGVGVVVGVLGFLGALRGD